MTLPANIRVNVRAPFPARVTGAGPISISKSNGVWQIGFSISGLQAPPSSLSLGATDLMIQDPVTGLFYVVSASLLWGAGALVRKNVAQGSTYAASPTDGDMLIVAGSAAPTTVNLFNSTLANRPQTVVDTTGNAGTNAITINRSGSDTINGQSSVQINSDYGAITLYPLIGGGGWYLK